MTKQSWAVSDSKCYVVPETNEQLPAGMYAAEVSNQLGPYLAPSKVVTDKLMTVEDDEVQNLMAEFDRFWNAEEKYKQRGLIHKRGFLLWGPPGTGKTSVVNLLAAEVISKRNGLVIIGDDPHDLIACLQMLRRSEPTRPVMVLLEDFENILNMNSHSLYLRLLDGESQIDNVLFVATTNYPEDIPDRFIKRPSRFDTIVQIGMPSKTVRRNYLLAKEPTMAKATLDEIVKLSDGLSIAHLKEIIIATEVMGQRVPEVIKRLRTVGNSFKVKVEKGLE